VTYLLDVNVLIALIDPAHVAHDAAHAWFSTKGFAAWATCPMTENAVLRIVGHPKYPNTPGAPAAIAGIVSGLRAHPGHAFWGDDVSLIDNPDVDPAKLLTSGQVTDTYLLALAKARGGMLATFDRKLSVAAVANGQVSLHQIKN
jgi:hypothetical protein